MTCRTQHARRRARKKPCAAGFWALRTAALVCLSAGPVSPAMAQDTPDSPPSVAGTPSLSNPPPPAPLANRAALLNLAHQFVKKIGGGMARADILMGLSESKSGAQGPQQRIADGTEMILQARVGQDTLEGDMIAIQEAGRTFVSLQDFFAVLGFPIRIDPEKKQAQGWFIRETRSFSLDGASGTVSVDGRTYTLDPLTFREEEGDYRVTLDTLGTWFDMTFDLDVSRQMMVVHSADPLPIQQRHARRARRIAKASGAPPSKMPRQEDPPALYDMPFVDVALNTQARRSQTGQPFSKTVSSSVLTSGDLAGMTVKSFSASSLRDSVNSVRVSARKVSEDDDLLGPVKARAFEIGDITPVRLPLAGGSGQEQGVRITNRDANQSVTFSTTDIEGDAQPGWDVELYRGEQIVGFQEVDQNGRYRFPDVRLLSGSNDFRLVFYGLNGERREEERSIPVDLDAASSAQSIWSVSATRRNVTTYNRLNSEQPEDGQIQLAATIEKGLGDTVLLNGGLRTVPQEETRKTYVEGGLSTVLGGALVTSNLAYDLDGEAAVEISARRNFGQQRLGMQAQINTSGYAFGGSSDNPGVVGASAQISGPLFSWNGEHFGYGLEASYGELADNESTVSASQNLNASMGPLRFNNALSYEKKSGFGDDQDGEEILDTFSSTFLWGDNQFRTSALYEIAPDPAMASVFASWLHKYTEKISSEVEAERFLKSGLNRLEARLNWRHDHFTLSPRVEMDSDGRVIAAIGARTGLAPDPRSGMPVFRGKSLTGAGGLSARVFLDNDGNGFFNTGDELVEGVDVMAIQSRRHETTDAQGLAFLTDLPAARATDISIDPSTLPDPSWIQGSQGVSILPRPGRVSQIQIPLHKSGEIDGTVLLAPPRREPYAASGIRLYLYDMSGRKKMFTTTAYDGFYLFSMIPPGDYYLLPAPEDLELLRAESPLPQKIRIGYNGTVLYGQDVSLVVRDEKMATLAIADGPGDYLLRNANVPDLSKTHVILDLGAYRSRLMMALVWYRLKTRYGVLLGGSELLVKPSESLPDSEGKHILRVSQNDDDLDDARRKCRAIAARGIGCRVEFLPRGGGTQGVDLVSNQ